MKKEEGEFQALLHSLLPPSTLREGGEGWGGRTLLLPYSFYYIREEREKKSTREETSSSLHNSL